MSSPSRLGRYPVRRRLGAGAFATVWLAYDEQLDSPVAIKVLAENWTQDLHVRRRFLEEGRFLRKVESPHVVSVYDAGELDDSRPFLVMSYADQGTLADRLELSRLSPSQAMHVVGQVGQGLHALHRRGVLHRDVKPANVLFRTVEGDGGEPQTSAMLGDLGLGKAMDVSSRLTMIGGTPSYVAPEQARGEQLDARADQYSLAVLAYLLLGGRPAYSHATLGAAADPGPPPPLDGELPAAVDSVLRRALRVDREHRYPDVTAFVVALEEALGEPAEGVPGAWVPLDPDLTRVGAPPTTSTRRRRSPVPVVAAALALAGGAALGVLLHDGAAPASVSVTDSTSSLEVSVPRAWTAVTATGQWTPPDQDRAQPSLSVGTAPGWNESGSAGEGLFLGVMAADDMPEQLPGHGECDTVLDAVSDVDGQDPLLTQVATGCPGVVVERVRQVAQGRYLWIQVRSSDRATAYDVLEAVSAPGF